MAVIEEDWGTVIKLDFDRKFTACRFDKWAREANKLLRFNGIMVQKATVYDTHSGHHVEIQTANILPDELTVFYQAILGSDPFRETFNYQRIRYGMRKAEYEWNILFHRKTVFDKDGNVTFTHERTKNNLATKHLQKRLSESPWKERSSDTGSESDQKENGNHKPIGTERKSVVS